MIKLRGKLIVIYGLISWVFSIMALVLSLYFLPDSFTIGESVVQTYGLLWFSLQLTLVIVFLNTLHRKEGKILPGAFILSVWLVYVMEDTLFHLIKYTVLGHEFQSPELIHLLKSLLIVSGMMTVIGIVKIWQLKTRQTAMSVFYGFVVMVCLGLLIKYLAG